MFNSIRVWCFLSFFILCFDVNASETGGRACSAIKKRFFCMQRAKCAWQQEFMTIGGINFQSEGRCVDASSSSSYKPSDEEIPQE
jgi:hypothetical protein